MSEREKVKRYPAGMTLAGVRNLSYAQVMNESLVESLTIAIEQRESLLREVEELEKEVREWICERCHRVYPGMPQPNEQNLGKVICPDCNGVTMPKGIWERRELTTDRDRLRDSASKVVDVLNAYQGGKLLLSNQGQALDGISALANFVGAAEKLRRVLDQPAQEEDQSHE